MDKLFIKRKAILTLDNGAKIEADVIILHQERQCFTKR